ncbi:MAG: ABC transporter permease [Bacteroidales bacterium]|nr:ABC transporter permease [Bacteroidales bacterium]
MNVEYYIAKRLLKKQKVGNRFSRPIVSIAIVGIALGLAVMILAVAIVTGFKNEITQKVIGFGSHIQIVNYDTNNSYETIPISNQQEWIDDIKNIEGVQQIQQFITKAGISKTDNYLQGVVLKGIGSDFDWSFFNTHLFDGELIEISDTVLTNQVVISKYLANALQLSVGDDIRTYFIQDPPRMRKFSVAGIYDTGLEDLDKIYAFVDIKHLQKLNNWEDNQITGFEVLLDDYSHLTNAELQITKLIGNRFSDDGSMLRTTNIRSEYPQIFDWLSLLDMNVWVILILMVSVAGFNMVSGLLVLILERVNMIGILKSLGAKNFSVRKVFLYHASFLTLRGLLIGNIIGILLCFIQLQWGVFTLDPSSYYVSSVPINLNIIHLLLLNVGTLIVTFFMMIVPSLLITRISPVQAIQFD